MGCVYLSLDNIKKTEQNTLKMEDIDKKIDQALKILYESKDWISKSDDLEDNDVTRENNIVEILVDRELAVRSKDTIYNLNFVELNIPTCKISTKGIEVIRQGGWLKYLDKEKKKLVRAEKKEFFDYNISKWQSKTFWPVLIIGLFGGIYSAFDFFDKHLSINERQEVKVRQPINESGKNAGEATNKNELLRNDSLHYERQKN